MKEFWIELRPIIADLAYAIVSAASLVALGWLRQHFNIKLEEKDMNALQLALSNGVKSAVTALGPNAPQESVVSAAIDHANKSVPDAMRRLEPQREVLENIAAAKLQTVQLETTAAKQGGAVPC